MRAAVLVVALLLGVPAATATTTSVDFFPPAWSVGAISVTGGEWLSLVLEGLSDGLVEYKGATTTNSTYLVTDAGEPNLYNVTSGHAPVDSRVTTIPDGKSRLEHRTPAMAHIIIYAAEIALNFRGEAEIALGGGTTAASWPERQYRDFRDVPLPESVVIAGEGGAWNLSVRGLRYLQLGSFQVSCANDSPCHRGGGSSEIAAVGPARSRMLWIEEIRFGTGSMTLAGQSLRFATGGGGPSVRVEGELRLPRARSETACINCTEEGTFRLQGTTTLNDMKAAEGGRITGALAGTNVVLVRDEEPAVVLFAGPGSAIIATAAAGITLGGGLVLIAWALFHRAAPLGHPSRQRILALLRADPGLTHAGIAERLGLSRTTVRFHVRVMNRGDLLDQYSQGSKRHFFLNKGSARFPVGTSDAAAMFAAASHGLARSIVQALSLKPRSAAQLATVIPGAPSLSRLCYHLKKLEAVGVVAGTKAGRVRTYRLAMEPNEAYIRYEKADFGDQ